MKEIKTKILSIVMEQYILYTCAVQILYIHLFCSALCVCVCVYMHTDTCVCEFYFVPEYCSCCGSIIACIGCQWKYYCLGRKPVSTRNLESVFFCSTTLFYGGV